MDESHFSHCWVENGLHRKCGDVPQEEEEMRGGNSEGRHQEKEPCGCVVHGCSEHEIVEL